MRIIMIIVAVTRLILIIVTNDAIINRRHTSKASQYPEKSGKIPIFTRFHHWGDPKKGAEPRGRRARPRVRSWAAFTLKPNDERQQRPPPGAPTGGSGEDRKIENEKKKIKNKINF